MKDHYAKAIMAGVLGAFGCMVFKKLDDIQAEIEHLEDSQNVWSRKTIKRIQKERRKEERRKEKEGES